MIEAEVRKKQIAKQLGVNVRVLEQYLQHKRAEAGERHRPTPKIDRVRNDRQPAR